VLRFCRRARPEIPAASIIALSLRSAALSAVSESLLADKCLRGLELRNGRYCEAAKMTAHLAHGEIVALLQITHLMGGIGQLVSVTCDVSRQKGKGRARQPRFGVVDVRLQKH
jgi:hypothetical protein